MNANSSWNDQAAVKILWFLCSQPLAKPFFENKYGKYIRIATLGTLIRDKRYPGLAEFVNERRNGKLSQFLQHANDYLHDSTIPKDALRCIFVLGYTDPENEQPGTDCAYVVAANNYSLLVLKAEEEIAKKRIPWNFLAWHKLTRDLKTLCAYTVAISLPKLVINECFAEFRAWLASDLTNSGATSRIIGYYEAPAHFSPKNRNSPFLYFVFTFFPEPCAERTIRRLRESRTEWRSQSGPFTDVRIGEFPNILPSADSLCSYVELTQRNTAWVPVRSLGNVRRSSSPSNSVSSGSASSAEQSTNAASSTAPNNNHNNSNNPNGPVEQKGGNEKILDDGNKTSASEEVTVSPLESLRSSASSVEPGKPLLQLETLQAYHGQRTQRIEDAVAREEDNPFDVKFVKGEASEKDKAPRDLVVYENPNQDWTVGSGSEGRIYYGRLEGGLVAIRSIKTDWAEKEVKAMRQIMQDPRFGNFCLPVYDVRKEGKFQFYIAQELGVCDLAKLVSEFTLDYKQKRDFVIQIALAIGFLHDSLGLVHRDIRPENIIVTVNMTCKLADFGFTRSATDQYARTMNTLHTGHTLQPYEICQHLKSGGSWPVKKSIDIFMFGCTIYHLFHNDHVWELQEHCRLVAKREPPTNVQAGMYGHFKFLLLWMLDHDAKARPTIAEVLKHPAISGDFTSDSVMKLFGRNRFWKDTATPLTRRKWKQFWFFVGEHPHFQPYYLDWQKFVPQQLLSFRPHQKTDDPLHILFAFIRNGISHCNEEQHDKHNGLFLSFTESASCPSWGDRCHFFLYHESVAWFHSALALYASQSAI